MQQTVIDQIDKFKKLCLWRGADINAKPKPKAVWLSVCREKEEGSLGVLNLKTPNESLLVKHLHNFLTGRIFLGFLWFGRSTINLESCLEM